MELRPGANPLPPLTPFEPATMIQSLDGRGCGLRVVFFKPEGAADRWGHVIATVENAGGGAGEGGERVVTRLVSCEGEAADGWPLSPPLQSLAIEGRPGGAVALLVGMSGQSHWSASFEALADRRLVVDIACRLGTGGAWRLGSQYQSPQPIATKGGESVLECAGERRVWLELGPEIAALALPDGVFLDVKQAPNRPVRWKYSVYCG